MGSSVLIEELMTERVMNLRRSENLIPGGLVFSGPGCYRLALEGQGRRYECNFPVRFEPAEGRLPSDP